jgi:hypothetical protein
VLRVEQPALKALLERLEHRLPVHARRFHPNQRHTEPGEPLAQGSEPRERRGERLRVLRPSATISPRDTDRRDDIVAMHVKTRAPLDYHIHPNPPVQTAYRVVRRGPTEMSLRYALEAAVNGTTGPRATLFYGLKRTKRRRR